MSSARRAFQERVEAVEVDLVRHCEPVGLPGDVEAGRRWLLAEDGVCPHHVDVEIEGVSERDQGALLAAGLVRRAASQREDPLDRLDLGVGGEEEGLVLR